MKTGGGFGGTGFKFDEAEAQYTTEKKKFQKAALGLQVQFQKAALGLQVLFKKAGLDLQVQFKKAGLGLHVQFKKAALSQRKRAQRKCNSVEFKKRKD